ncbi:enoyl-CoA hydratase [Sporosarcina sp. P13]|uniref:enoyl-CoA hydratase n=1 Tax=Sporosarcina sp. P13 TaxID=2048263 RepID=UPI000C1651D0|nr:enoyl-CoA hydratase [Sporosarcina sp. P13]PIC62686.1 enoyl-CoA hydratase [Sporosarcina sp. P13]
MYTLVDIKKENGIAIVTIENPPFNVLNNKVVVELEAVFTTIENDPEVIVSILTGSGDKAFMAGADIKEFPDWIGREDVKDIAMNTHRMLNQIDFLPKPTIAVLNGLTLGGGCELALACDLRIAESHAQIGLPEVKLGLLPGGGGTQRLPRLIGDAKAKELMFTGDPISADEAKAIGLINQVVPSGDGLSAALIIAKKMASYSLQSLSLIKKAVDEGKELPFNKALENEAAIFGQVFLTEDVKEGVQAFLEKRKPIFKHF